MDSRTSPVDPNIRPTSSSLAHAKIRVTKTTNKTLKMQQTCRPKRILDLAQSICLLVCLVSILLATCVGCKQDQPSGESLAGPRRESADSMADESTLSEPRQYFKNHAGSSQAQKRAFRGSVAGRRSELVAGSRLKDQQSSTGGQKQRISNATLKKLLNQSMAAFNGSSLSSSSNGTNYYKTDKGSNFKFVFIQRATALPKSQAATKSDQSATTPKTGSNNSTQSLAASVSKQLAKSLLNSASNLVGNLSSVPSLSSLASQMIGQPLDSPESNSIKSGSRRKLASSGKDSTLININTEAADQASKGKAPATKSRPSKIYNLPVKFVANGQPNHVVFNTIKKHFATIKKIQDERQKSLSGDQQQDKQRRRNKLKGNSRLIYLPIKYLSNAKPNRILAAHSTKSQQATHKSRLSS